MTEQPQPGEYPRQELLPQQVQATSRRRWWWLAAAVAAAGVVAVVAVVLLRGGDDSGRAAYCDRLTELTAGGDLDAALSQTDSATFDQVLELADEAPGAVADDWDRLVRIAESAQGGEEPSVSDLIGAYGALQAIAADARDECDLDVELPSL